ncbi:MAG: ABC transporter transmembrane domain-containing protein, partial [Methylocystis sp.]
MRNFGKSDAGAQDRAEAVLSESSLLKTIRHLWPYIWPRGRRDLELRVAIVFILLFISKGFNALTPYAYKWATDALAQGGADSWQKIGVSAVYFTLLMGAIRIVAVILMQARDAIFAAVAMHAVRRLATDLFVHMHELSLRFHISRKTGGLTRVLERGRNAIETLSRLIMSTGAPT